jgi:hypothetical protein
MAGRHTTPAPGKRRKSSKPRTARAVMGRQPHQHTALCSPTRTRGQSRRAEYARPEQVDLAARIPVGGTTGHTRRIGDPSLEWAICPVTLRGNCLAALHRAKPVGWLEMAEMPGPAHGVNRQSDLATGGATVLQEERDRALVQLMPGVPACTGAVSRTHNRFTLGVAPRPCLCRRRLLSGRRFAVASSRCRSRRRRGCRVRAPRSRRGRAVRRRQ